jgi:hypothetical protein
MAGADAEVDKASVPLMILNRLSLIENCQELKIGFMGIGFDICLLRIEPGPLRPGSRSRSDPQSAKESP